MSETAINIQNLGKRYRYAGTAPLSYNLRADITEWIKCAFRHDQPRRATLHEVQEKHLAESPEYFWALKDINLEIKQGEVVGIIGRNGAGKSTLLKILSRITPPTTGTITYHGRVASLLEVGTGFHRELTGRENIFLNGSILGMKRAEIARRFDEIVAFAEVDKFIDTPVKFYSSGMYVRLAFAVAAHLQPEILIVDEVLAVGDSQFQKKCLGKMEDIAKQGQTVLFVSHNLAAIQNLCPRAALLDKGVVIRDGNAEDVICYYIQRMLPEIVSVPLSNRKDRSGNGRVRLTGFRVEDDKGTPVDVLQSGRDAAFVFDFECDEGTPPTNVSVGLSVHTTDQHTLFVLYNSYTGQVFEELPRHGQFRCSIPRLPLRADRYRIGARVTVAGEEADWPHDGIAFVDVEQGDFYGTGSLGFEGASNFLVDGIWSCRPQSSKHHEATVRNTP